MKKLFAVVLAVAMLCTMAFAATANTDDTYDDTTNMFWGDDVWAVKSYANAANEIIGLRLPGDNQTLEINYELFDFLNDGANDNDAVVNEKNYLVRVNFAKGADLVESQGFVDGKYIIKLKQDYTKIEDAVADLEISRIYISLRGSLNDHIELKEVKNYVQYTVANGQVNWGSLSDKKHAAADGAADAIVYLLKVDNFYTGGTNQAVGTWPEYLQEYKGLARFDVGYPVIWTDSSTDTIPVTYGTTSVAYTEDNDLNPSTQPAANELVYGTPFGAKSSVKYINAHSVAYTYSANVKNPQSFIVGFTGDDARRQDYVLYAYGADATSEAVYEVGLTFTLNKGEYHWIQVSYDTDKAINAIADAAEADISYINFVGNPTFKNTVSAAIFADDDQFIYAYADGKLTDSGFKWDDEKGYWVMEGKTLSNYIVSDVELKTEAAGETNNPETGANDIVGIASALAIVSVISAAAISLKK